MCHRLDERFFEELAAMPAEDVCRRTLCDYDEEKSCYRINAWNGEYEVYTSPGRIAPTDRALPPVNIETGLSIVFYLLRACEKPVTGEWISEKDLPGGVTFFRGPHSVPVHIITGRFGGDIAGFRESCLSQGGAAVDMADAAFVFRVLPRVPVAALYWRPDDEFEAEAKLLFDRSISEHLPIDVVFGLTEELCARVAEAREKGPSWHQRDPEP